MSRRVGWAATLFLWAGLSALPLSGQTAGQPESTGFQESHETPEPTPTSERFTLHGYLTQAYAQSSDVPVYGMTKTGRADYRLLALQIRYALDDDDEFVTQVRHRHFGASPLIQFEPELALVWAYYQRHFGPFSARVGRIPIEQGIYSETRFVGTLVPFFRAPVTMYAEGVESIDGASVYYTAPPVAGWTVQASASAGTSEFKDVLPFLTGLGLVDQVFYRDYVGQVWVDSPIPGVRVGGNTHIFYERTDTTPRHRNETWTLSADATFDRLFVRAEHNQGKVPTFGTDVIGHYIQGGVRVLEPLTLTYQYEFLRLHFPTPSGPLSQRSRDRGAGVVYALRPSVHLKVERHRDTGYRFDTFVPLTSPALSTNYWISSFSTSF